VRPRDLVLVTHFMALQSYSNVQKGKTTRKKSHQSCEVVLWPFALLKGQDYY